MTGREAMRIGVFIDNRHVDQFVTDARDVAQRGFPSLWAPQVFHVDALTTLAIAAREVPGIDVGTAVVPTYPRHPMVLAAQALTVQQVSRGRLTLGIGLSHQVVIESLLGLSFEKPVRHL